MRKMLALIASLLLLTLPSLALGQTRALLVACHDFLSMPGLGNSVSGNLHIIGSALVGAGLNVGSLSIEDGTIGTLDHLRGAINDAFNGADETDLSILYLCTHGVLSSADDGQVYLMLGDGKSEAPLSRGRLAAASLLHTGRKAADRGRMLFRRADRPRHIRAKPASGQPRAVARVHGNAFPRGFKHSRADLRQRI